MCRCRARRSRSGARSTRRSRAGPRLARAGAPLRYDLPPPRCTDLQPGAPLAKSAGRNGGLLWQNARPPSPSASPSPHSQGRFPCLIGRSSASSPFAAAVFCLLLSGGDAGAQGAPLPAVTVAPVVSREVRATADFVGRVTPINKVDIVARVPGFIGQRLFTEGQMVKTGDLLFRIEPDTYKAAVEQQTANLAKAKAAEVNAALAARPRQGAGQEPEHPAIDGRPARGRRSLGAGRRARGAGGARSGADQSRLHRDSLAHRRTDRARQLHRRESGRPQYRHARDDREPGPDLRDLPGERARHSRLQAPHRRARRSERPRRRPRAPARRHDLRPAGPQQFPRHPGDRQFRHGGGAGRASEPAGALDRRRRRRRRRRGREAAERARRAAIRGGARPGRKLRPGRRSHRRRSSSGASRRARTRAPP